MPKERDIDYARLALAMQRSRLALRFYREERREAVRQYVGHHWSEEGSDREVPVNLIALYIQIVSRNLIAKNPRVLLSTWKRQHKPTISAMGQWANKEVERMCLAKTLQRVVLDALFSIGICKVALATPDQAAHLAWGLKAGQPFAERVDLDDFVFDTHARDFEEVSFIGHRYRVPLEVVRESKIYSKARKELVPSTDPMFNREGDERISTLGRQYYAGNTEEFEDFVDLWEVYLPRHRVVCTLADDQLLGATPTGIGASDPLRVQKWLGPYCGPYHLLTYGLVPGNCMPKAPVQDLIDLHEACNRQLRKIIRDCDSYKKVTGYMGSATEDAQRVQGASNNELIRMDNPEKVRTYEFGGPSPQLFAVFGALKDLFSWLGGNLDMMGGLSPQSKTATQDKLLAQNASGQVADLQDITVTFTSDVIESLCWYWHHDPQKVMTSQHSLPGMPEFSITRQVSPQMRQKVMFEDLEVKVDPYSLQHQTPQSKLQGLTQFVMQIYTPLAQIMQQQGVVLDLNAFSQMVGEFMDMPELAEILTLREPPQQDTMGSGGQPGMPAQTSRTYTRENMPGRTQQGDNMNRINAAMGIDTGGASKNGSSNGTYS